MNDEVEVGWVRLTDNTELVLTRLHVIQHENRGIFGESQTIVPRGAITTVRIGWRRSQGLIVTGTVLIIVAAVFLGSSWLGFASDAAGKALFNLSPSTALSIQYGSLVGGIVFMILFWFYRRSEIQISAPSGTVGGTTKTYEDARKLCSLLVSESKQPPPAAKIDRKAPDKPKPADADWQL